MVLAIGPETKTVEFLNINEEDNVSVLLEIRDNPDQSPMIDVTAEVMKEGEVKSSQL